MAVHVKATRDPLKRLRAGAMDRGRHKGVVDLSVSIAILADLDLSTVMGSLLPVAKIAQEAEVDLAAAIVSDVDLLKGLEATALIPDPEPMRNRMMNLIVESLAPWVDDLVGNHRAQQVSMLEQAKKTADQYQSRQKTLFMHIENSLGKHDLASNEIVKTAVEMYDAINPMGKKRRTLVENFDRDVHKAAELIKKLVVQEQNADRYQDEVDAVNTLPGAYTCDADYPDWAQTVSKEARKRASMLKLRQEKLAGIQNSRDASNKEGDTLRNRISRTFNFPKVVGSTSQVGIKPLKFPEDLGKDKGIIIPDLMVPWAEKFPSKYWLVLIRIKRVAGDFDPVSKSWRKVDPRDYDKNLMGTLDREFEEYDKDLLSSVTMAQRVPITTGPI